MKTRCRCGNRASKRYFLSHLISRDPIEVEALETWACPDCWAAISEHTWLRQGFTIICADCGCSRYDCPMLHDHVWTSFALKHELLCRSCAEKRMRRPITDQDQIDCPMNDLIKARLWGAA